MQIADAGDVSAETVAEFLNLSAATVFQLAREGVLPRLSRGSYDLVACVHAYIEYCDAGKTNKENSGARSRLWAAQARKAELDIEKQLGRLIDADNVFRITREAVAVFANQIDAMAGRLASDLAATSDKAVIRQLLLNESSRILQACAQEFGRLEAMERDKGSGDKTASHDAGSLGERVPNSPKRKRRARTLAH